MTVVDHQRICRTLCVRHVSDWSWLRYVLDKSDTNPLNGVGLYGKAFSWPDFPTFW